MNTLEPKMQDVINYRFRQGILSAVSITEKPTICTHLNIQKRHRYCILLLGQYHRAQWYAYYKHWLRASGVYHGIGSTSKSGCHYFVQSTLTWQKESYVSEYNKKCSLPGSNWRPSDYETDALPTEPKELGGANSAEVARSLCKQKVLGSIPGGVSVFFNTISPLPRLRISTRGIRKTKTRTTDKVGYKVQTEALIRTKNTSKKP